MPSNPDFELYDNVGRINEQIHAYKTNQATTGDLRRWANRDAEDFLARHPLPTELVPTPDMTPYRAALAAARTPAEASAVTDAVLEALAPTLTTLSDYLADAAQHRFHDARDADDVPRTMLINAAGRLLQGLSMATDADMESLRIVYDPPPPAPSPPAGKHAPPPPPDGGIRPGRGR